MPEGGFLSAVDYGLFGVATNDWVVGAIGVVPVGWTVGTGSSEFDVGLPSGTG